MAYTDVQKATACEIIRERKGVIDEEALRVVQEAIEEPKLPKMTLWRWWKHYQSLLKNPEGNANGVIDKPKSVIDVTGLSLDNKFEAAANIYIDHALKPELLLWTSSKDAMGAAEIAVRNMRLLRDLPTEIIGGVLQIVTNLQEAGLNVTEEFHKLVELSEKAKAAKRGE